MNVSYQTWVVVALAVAQFAVAQVLANVSQLGIADKPWLVLVVLPVVATALTLAANQMKPVGGPTPAP